ncbi:hypothetical protein J1N35_037883 [Gossypium stocksii]|uniref:Aminotransferase-like plant mobile domain-containing protein n=1 Tax=Gossypium stocksii TaxID=47602 RepID=A0A9D3UMT6_9ROSI|nr:hypothetical protein J1N35_037883 [Gossypium stocksii]
MVGSLIRLDDKHISVNQLQMVEDQILQCHIRNLLGPPSPLMETYLREASFFHVAYSGWGRKLDQKLKSALVERWRPEMHTFHLPCNECTITLQDVQLQLGLPMDGSVVTGSVQFTNWGPWQRILLKREDYDTLKRTSFRLSRFEWTPYEDLAMRAVILDEFLVNPNAWHVKSYVRLDYWSSITDEVYTRAISFPNDDDAYDDV